MRPRAVSKGRWAARRGARRRLTWSQCPSSAESCGRTLFIRLGRNLGEPCVQLAYRERRGDCRLGGTWLLAAWLILSRKVPLAGPEDRHESGLRKAVTTPSVPRLSGSRSLALPLSIVRSPALSSSPRAGSVRSRGARERGGERMEREVQVRRGLRAGSSGGRATRGEGLTRRRAKMNGGATAAGRGGRSPEPGFILRSVLYIFRRRWRRERRRGGRPPWREGRPGWAEAEPLGSLVGLGIGWRASVYEHPKGLRSPASRCSLSVSVAACVASI